MDTQPTTPGGYIDSIRGELVCERCGKYVGSLDRRRYLPPPYSIAVENLGVDDEARALIAFEWHMVNQLRAGAFVIQHPDRDGECVTYREWIASDEDDEMDGHGAE